MTLGPCPDDAALARAAADPDATPDVLSHADACPRCAGRLEEAFRAGALAGEVRRTAKQELDFPHPPGFRILREVSRGGQGIVYAAEHIATERRVALKILLHGRWATSEQRVRIKREAKLAARMRHPNVVQIFDMGALEDGTAYLVMEWIEGSGLEEHLGRMHERGAAGDEMVLDQVLDLFDAVAAGVEAVHSADILHRDLKPSNVMVDEKGKPRLIDFGLAKELHSHAATLTRSGGFLGSLVWAAPEQLDPELPIDERTDVHGLGLILHHALTGEPPHDRDSSFADLLWSVTRVTAPPPSRSARMPGVGLALDEVVARALHKDPNERFGSVAELRQALSKARRAPDTVWMWARSRARTLALAAALIVAAGILWMWTGERREAHARESLRATADEFARGGQLLPIERTLWNLATDHDLDLDALASSRWRADTPDFELGWMLRGLYAKAGWTWAAELGIEPRVRWTRVVGDSLAVSRVGSKQVELWSLPPREVVRRLECSFVPMFLTPSPDGRWLFSEADRPDTRIALWDLASDRDEPVYELETGAHGVGLLPDGEILIAGVDLSLEVRRITDGDLVRTLPLPEAMCRETGFPFPYLTASPAGRLAFLTWYGCGGYHLARTDLVTGETELWRTSLAVPVEFLSEDEVSFDLRYGRTELPLSLGPRFETSLQTGHSFSALARGPGGRTFLRGEPVGGATLIDLRTVEALDRTESHPTRLVAQAATAEGGLILTDGRLGRARAWSPLQESWTTRHRLSELALSQAEASRQLGLQPCIHDVAFLGAGNDLVTADGHYGTVTTWREGRPARTVRLQEPSSHQLVTGVDAARDDPGFVVACADAGVFVDVLGGPDDARLSYRFPSEMRATTVRLRPVGTELVALSDRGELVLLNRAGTVLQELDVTGDGQRVGSCDWSPDGDRLIVGAGDGRVFEFRFDDGRLSRTARTFGGAAEENAGAVACGSSGLVAAGYRSGRVLLWEGSESPARVLKTGNGYAFALDLVGDVLVAANGNGDLSLWAAHTGVALARLQIETPLALAAQASPTGDRIAVAGAPAQVVVAELGRLESAIREHAPAFQR